MINDRPRPGVCIGRLADAAPPRLSRLRVCLEGPVIARGDGSFFMSAQTCGFSYPMEIVGDQNRGNVFPWSPFGMLVNPSAAFSVLLAVPISDATVSSRLTAARLSPGIRYARAGLVHSEVRVAISGSFADLATGLISVVGDRRVGDGRSSEAVIPLNDRGAKRWCRTFTTWCISSRGYCARDEALLPHIHNSALYPFCYLHDPARPLATGYDGIATDLYPSRQHRRHPRLVPPGHSGDA